MARNTDYETTLNRDAGESYANVAAYGQSKVSYVGTLQQLAKSFLKWDKTADKGIRRELQRFATISLTVENCSVATTRIFQEIFAAALVSSAENDRPTGKYLAGAIGSETDNQTRRAAYTRAIEDGASEATIKHAMSGADKGGQ